MTNRLISEKIVSWDFAPPFDFTAQFLASRAERRGEQTIALASKKSRSPIWCSILKIVRTHFAACGGDGQTHKI